MEVQAFEAIAAYLNEKLEGDAYTINVRTHSGAEMIDRSWEWLPGTPERDTVILRRDGYAPLFLHVGSIETIELVS